MPEALAIIIRNNVLRAGPGGCSLEWLARRVNAGRDAIEIALADRIREGAMTETSGVYRLVDARRARHALRRLKRAWKAGLLRAGKFRWPEREVRRG
jgi:hypothetical protein